jgi:hypothetical protein
MGFLKTDLFRSFGIGFALGCAALFLTAVGSGQSASVVPAAVAAPAQ